MLTKNEFTSMLDAIRKKWQYNTGCVVLFDGCEELKVCVGAIRNRDSVVAENCVVWFDGTKLYEGSLFSQRLFDILKRAKCTGILIGTPAEAQKGTGVKVSVSTKAQKHAKPAAV